MKRGKWVWEYLHWNARCNDETTCMEGGSMGTVTSWLQLMHWSLSKRFSHIVVHWYTTVATKNPSSSLRCHKHTCLFNYGSSLVLETWISTSNDTWSSRTTQMLNKFPQNPVTATISSRTSISMNSFHKTYFLMQFQRAYLLRRRTVQKSSPFKISVQAQTTWRSFIHPQHSWAMRGDGITWFPQIGMHNLIYNKVGCPEQGDGKAKQSTNQWNK